MSSVLRTCGAVYFCGPAPGKGGSDPPVPDSVTLLLRIQNFKEPIAEQCVKE
jgi:hypothetical protein